MWHASQRLRLGLVEAKQLILYWSHDCRFAGRLFARQSPRCSVNAASRFPWPGFVSTPMISLGAVKLKADLGISLTASHNPPSTMVSN
ncbi:MAG: hypothetical protein U0X34_02895 [Bacteroidia bacterium]